MLSNTMCSGGINLSCSIALTQSSSPSFSSLPRDSCHQHMNSNSNRKTKTGRQPDADKGTKPSTISHIRDIFYRQAIEAHALPVNEMKAIFVKEGVGERGVKCDEKRIQREHEASCSLLFA